MQRKELDGAAALTVLDAEQFKTSRISIYFILPSQRQTATAFALLPQLLERGYAGCPDMTALSRKLAALYGANLSADSSMQGGNRVISISISGLRDAYALHGEPLSAAYAEVLFGAAFEPYFVGGVFDPDAVAVEKEKLRELLEGEINNKRGYCIKQARRKFFGDSPAGIERSGYLEDIDDVTPRALTQAYAEMVASASIEVMVLGADAGRVEEMLREKLAKLQRTPTTVLPPVAMPAVPVQTFAEPVDAVQGKLCLMFTAGRVLTKDELGVMRSAAALFGGLPTSRLFRNVREKQSLCYYCASSFSYLTSAMSVDSGIEPQNGPKVRQAVLNELAAMVNGPITQQELDETRLALLGALRAVNDSLASIEFWAFREILRGSFETPQQAERTINETTAEQIQQVLSLFTLSVSYLLAKGGAGVEQ